MTNKYEAPEILEIGRAEELVLGPKDVPNFEDSIYDPTVNRTLPPQG